MMGLTRREAVFAAITGILLAILAGRSLFSELFGTGRQLRQLRANVQQQVERLEKRLARTKNLQAQLADFGKRSLPANSARARSLYGNWILERAKASGWQNTFLEIGDARAGGFYQSLRFTLKGEATWEGLARFLYSFYSTPFLHKIRMLSIQPKERSSLLEVNLSVEALSLNDALQQDTLPQLAARSLPAGDVKVYAQALSQRNLFAAYSPPPPSPPRPPIAISPPSSPPLPPPFDASRFAYLTAIVGSPDRLEAWIHSRTEGKTYVLREGDVFQIGLLRGKLARLELRSAEIEAEGRRWRVGIGESLRSQVLLAPTSSTVGGMPSASPASATVPQKEMSGSPPAADSAESVAASPPTSG
jgi:hypothetical protein